MSLRLPTLKTAAFGLVALVVVYLLFAWLALPRILQAQAEKFIAEKTGHRLTLDRPEFNPFELSLRLANLHLVTPDGKPLFGFRELTVDLSAASIYRRALVFDSIRLDGPETTLVQHVDGRLNWSPLIDALKSKEEKPEAPLPRLDIGKFVLAGGKLDFADDKIGFATRVEPLDLELNDISTLLDDQDKRGNYKVTAHTTLGARVLWQGDMTIAPLAAAGHVGIEELDLARLGPLLKDVLPAGAPAGTATLVTDYRLAYAAGRLDLTLDRIAAQLAGLRVTLGKAGPDIAVAAIDAKSGRYDLTQRKFTLASLILTGNQAELPRPAGGPLKLLQLGSLALEDVQVDLAGRKLSLGRVALKDGQLGAVRNAQGRIDVVDALQALTQTAGAGAASPAADAKPAKQPARVAPSPAAPSAPGTPGWKYRVNKLELSGFSATLQDQSVKPAASVALEDIALAVDGISEDRAAPLPVRASLRAHDGGSFEASGQVVPATPSADLRFKLVDLSLKPAQPYLGGLARLKLTGGKLSIDGGASYDKRGPAFNGGFALRDLRLVESDTGALFLAWQSFGSRDLKATPARLDIGTLAINGLDAKLIINEDKSTNVSHILRKQEAAKATPATPAAPTPSATSATTAPATPAAAPVVATSKTPARRTPPTFQANIDRLRLSNGQMDFADLSLALPFGTHIHHLRGAINGLSTRAGAAAQIELDGQVDDYGLARAVGQVNMFKPTEFMDIKVVFRNVEMNRLTPYSATFAGRKIESGKLSLDLEYKINKRQLAGENKLVMERLTLGERVESPTAKNLPLDLAIAILEDSDGRIDLGLPVSGSLDDPQFSYGGIIWKAILNVFTKIATAPFRMLGALLGGSGEKFESIAFEAGDAQLTPPEREKLVRLAEALGKRPGLSLTLHGVYADADRLALQDRQLRRSVAKLAGQQVDSTAEQEDPGPLSTHTPKVQAALEKLYADRIGSSELAALKEGFRKANPGQMEESVAGKMMSRLSGLVREKRTLNEQEMAQLKGADFHATLFEQLRSREMVSDAQLEALAKARGEYLIAALTGAGAGAASERLTLAPVEKVDSTGRDIPVKLVLGAAPRQPQTAPTTSTPPAAAGVPTAPAPVAK